MLLLLHQARKLGQRIYWTPKTEQSMEFPHLDPIKRRISNTVTFHLTILCLSSGHRQLPTTRDLELYSVPIVHMAYSNWHLPILLLDLLDLLFICLLAYSHCLGPDFCFISLLQSNIDPANWLYSSLNPFSRKGLQLTLVPNLISADSACISFSFCPPNDFRNLLNR